MFKTLAYFGLECLPMIFYYGISYYTDFRTATALYVVATLFIVVLTFKLARRLPYLSLIFGFFVIASGVVTVFSHNPDIIIFSDSVYFILGAFAMGGTLLAKRTLLERLFNHAFAVTHRGWIILTVVWIIIFLIAGITNEVVRLTMTPEWWIGFQFWRGCIIAALTVLSMGITHHYRLPESTYWGIKTHHT